MLGSPGRDHWRRYEDVADLLAGATDDEWDEDRELIDDQLTDPWERQQ